MDRSNFIWNIADDELRNVFKKHEYGSIILPFTVLRRLDCIYQPFKEQTQDIIDNYKGQLDDDKLSKYIMSEINLPYFNKSKFDLIGLKSDPQNIFTNFTNYLNGFSENIIDIMNNFEIKIHSEKLNKNNILYNLINKFTEVDFHPSNVSNHEMGTIYEELLRKFSEQSNEQSGDHYTPRDIVELLAAIVFEGDKENLQETGKIASIYDCCCGTGGMLTVGKKWVLDNINPNLKINLYGQEINDSTYAICKSDFLITGENPENIKGPDLSSLSQDQYEDKYFDYMLVNPPFGVSWKTDKDHILNEKNNPNGRFFAGTPRSSDGQLLFLQHLISKMEPTGSRIGIIFNGSPLFTGDAGSGESEIRKWIIENDWLEAIVQLPDTMFFNTGITTYLFIVTNKKNSKRKGKIQLINGSAFFKLMRKNLGDKRKKISYDDRMLILKNYLNFEENEVCKIFENQDFGYTKITVDQPIIEEGKKKVDKKGKLKTDNSKRDYERVPLSDDVDEYFDLNVRPHLINAYMDRSKDKIGYEINFNKYFYKFIPQRSLDEISNDLKSLNEEIKNLSEELTDE